VPLPKVLTNGFIQPCIPIRSAKPPAGPDWIHEIKHDGYRLIVRRDGENVRLYTRCGNDWSDRYRQSRGLQRSSVQGRSRSTASGLENNTEVSPVGHSLAGIFLARLSCRLFLVGKSLCVT
jgi:hypothetical protein